MSGKDEDKNMIEKVTNNVYFRFVHQALTIVAPFIAAIFLHMYYTYAGKLDDIQDLLKTKVATYDQHFEDVDHRLNRLEVKNDYPTRRMP